MRVKISGRDGCEFFNETVSDFPFVIGRQAPAKFVVGVSGVSGQHAEISVEGKKIFVRDLGSRNGTFLDEERINLKAVSLPCRIRLGNSVVLELSEEGAQMREGEAAPSFKNANVVAPVKAQSANSLPHPMRPPRRLGWDSGWIFFARVDYRLLVLFVLTSMFPQLLFRWLASSGAWSHALVYSVTSTLAWVVTCAIGAALFAIPGWFFRRAYMLKPLFTSGLFAMIFVFFHVDFLVPMALSEKFGFLAQMISLPLGIFVSTLFFYVFLFNTFPPRLGKRLVLAAWVLGFMVGGVAALQNFSQDRQAVVKKLFTDPGTPSRIVAGEAISPSDLAAEMKKFEQDLQAP